MAKLEKHMEYKVNWLLTYCDGSGGYKTSKLLTPVGASLYLQKVEGLPKDEADLVVSQEGTEAIHCCESGEVLYPVPAEADDDPELDDEDDDDEE